MMSSRIHYPITAEIKYRSDTVIRTLEKDDIVKCYYCQKEFPVKGNVVIPDMYANKALRCPKCGKVVSVLYYFDRVKRKGKRSNEV